MNVSGKSQQTIWSDPLNPRVVHSIDQRSLPFELVIEQFRTVDEVAIAIRDMHLRGAPLIGVAAAFGLRITSYNVCYTKLLRRGISSCIYFNYGSGSTFFSSTFAFY